MTVHATMTITREQQRVAEPDPPSGSGNLQSGAS
jgi:hypothetical protein